MVIKLLPKPRGKVPRKPILGNEAEQKNKFHYLQTSSKINSGKKLIYNNFSKRLIRENPGIIKAIDFLSKNKLEKRFVDPKERFEVLRVRDFIVNDVQRLKSRGYLTRDAFVLRVNSGKKEYRFFLKNQGLSSVQELVLLKSIEEYAKKSGFNIIQPHLALDNNLDIDYNKRYIVYDFTDKLTVSDAFNSKKISPEKFYDIFDRLSDFKKLLENKYSIPIENLNTKNIFIDLSTQPHKLYLFDPFITGYSEPTSSTIMQLNKLIKNIIKK